ncbi:MAG: glycosyltransferase [Candidatus Eisenbacteria bacterium]|uniref:Glycosyltransferase n=1 Tax=Eiseniibacteriota bacterium TaxID=2212470 RepID=A0A538T9H5_UNCEI|nr:MAG: glycosyltransferase [Candidatus Eisenbacteria bacterium]
MRATLGALPWIASWPLLECGARGARSVCVGLYVAAQALLVLYSLHRCLLLWRRWRARAALRPDPPPPCDWPRVTVQLPVYNERRVIDRLIESVAALDYPADRLEIQVLDDSSDETRAWADRAATRQAARGVDIRVLHRARRDGFKAGALVHGMRSARGEFFAVFDSDFVPEPDFLRRTLPHFADPRVGMVQARWGHLNRDASLLTSAQAVLLDSAARVHRGCRWLDPRHADRGPGPQLPRPARGLALRVRRHDRGAGRAAGRPGGPPVAAAPLGQGLDPDRAQNPAPPARGPLAGGGQARGAGPSHEQPRLPAAARPAAPPAPGCDHAGRARGRGLDAGRAGRSGPAPGVRVPRRRAAHPRAETRPGARRAGRCASRHRARPEQRARRDRGDERARRRVGTHAQDGLRAARLARPPLRHRAPLGRSRGAAAGGLLRRGRRDRGGRRPLACGTDAAHVPRRLRLGGCFVAAREPARGQSRTIFSDRWPRRAFRVSTIARPCSRISSHGKDLCAVAITTQSERRSRAGVTGTLSSFIPANSSAGT